MVTELPAAPLVGESDVIDGAGETVKVTPLLVAPPAVTVTEPVVAAAGTGTVMLVSLQLKGVAEAPLNVMVLAPWVDPKPAPATVTRVFVGPAFGETLLMVGAEVTVKFTPALAWVPTVTVTGPLVAPAGTDVTIDVLLQLVGVAATPLKLTVLLPWEVPKFDPAIVTMVPTLPVSGLRLLIAGAGTVKEMELLAVPPTVTTKLPVAAPFGTLN